MHTYHFTIENYQAIRCASVDINGITVLSGINGCGKSTFSRWLYYIQVLLMKVKIPLING